jgi:predicted ATPase
MRTLTRVAAKNFLSLKDIDVKLGDLNVLVGPNGSGKTNFLNIFRFIGEIARTDLGPAIEAFGGFKNLAYRGLLARNERTHVILHLEGMMTAHAHANAPDEYTLDIDHMGELPRKQRIDGKDYTEDEKLTVNLFRRKEDVVLKRTPGKGRRITLSGNSVDVATIGKPSSSASKMPPRLEVDETSSGLAILRRLGQTYEAPQIEEIAQIFEQFRLFDVSVVAARRPAPADGSKRLNSDASNIAAFLIYLKKTHPERFELVKEDISFVLPGFRDFQFHTIGGADEAVRVDIVEAPLSGSTPLARASFGTIRSIALFAMLHDPNPPRLTCLEEVDHGLHPHALDLLVERLRDASKRTQIIVATHSPALVNRLEPEELIVFQRELQTGATIQPRISANEIRAMEKTSGLGLGELWFSGAIGGIL